MWRYLIFSSYKERESQSEIYSSAFIFCMMFEEKKIDIGILPGDDYVKNQWFCFD